MIPLPPTDKLTAAIALVAKTQKAIGDMTAEPPELQKKIDDYINNGDRTDDKSLAKVAAWQLRVQMVPAALERENARLRAVVIDLIDTVKEFGEGIASVGLAEHEEHLSRLIAHIKPFAPNEQNAETGESIDSARNIALRFPSGGIRVQDEALPAPPLAVPLHPQNEWDIAPHLRAALARAEALLKFHAEIKARGRMALEVFPRK